MAMVSESNWAHFYDFDSSQGMERLAAAEQLARWAYAKQAINDLLTLPVRAIRSDQVACAVVFGQVAFLFEPGGFAVASYEHGVLKDADGFGGAWLEGLPIRRSIGQLKELILELAVAKVAYAMSQWRGEPVDLRSNPHMAWALEVSDSKRFELEAELRTCLDETPKRVFVRLFDEMAKALAFDTRVASASCWMLLGEQDIGETYQRLQRVAGIAQAQRARRVKSLVANALALAFERGEAPEDVSWALRWFREMATENGVNRIGWRLLVDSPLAYWRRLLREGYDETKVWVALLVGQSSFPPRLPNQAEVRRLASLVVENDVERLLCSVPPQIWRSVLKQMRGGKGDDWTEVSDVLAWAARTGTLMPKTVRRANWPSLRRHAFEHALSRVDHGSLIRPLTAHEIVAKWGIVARRITNAAALEQTALIMRNCLSQYASEVESGCVAIYFAVKEKQRAVIMLLQSEPGGSWCVDEVKGPANLPAEHRFQEFAWELCTLWNKEEFMMPKMDRMCLMEHGEAML